jgi:hypothetical protein
LNAEVLGQRIEMSLVRDGSLHRVDVVPTEARAK